MDTSDFLIAIFSPRYYPNNYRPVGHLFFRTMAHAAGLKSTRITLARAGKTQIALSLAGHPIVKVDLDHSGRVTVRLKIDPAPAGACELKAETLPPYRVTGASGITITGFGFLPDQDPSPLF